MTRDKIKEGDICTLDESVAYSYNPHKPYEVVVLWHGINSQPLVTKLDEYKPFWTTYSQLIEVKRHIDLSIKALEQQTCKDAISREAVLGLFAQNADAVRPYNKTWEEVKALPPVTPQHTEAEIQKMQELEQAEIQRAYELGKAVQPKTGHWMIKRTSPAKLHGEHIREYECSICYREIRCTESQLVNYPYCHCGAKMVEPQESEVEE